MPAKKAPKCKIPCLRPPTFRIDDYESWNLFLDLEGFVVIQDAITTEDANNALETFKNEIKFVSPAFDWNDKTTWTTTNSPMVWNKSSVMFNGFGQSDSNWMLRLNSEAKNAFSHAYKTTDLVSSFDGFSLFLCDTQKSTSWLHQDQKSNDTRLSIQGILNVLPCDELDAGFICVPESHIDYNAPPQKNDWVTLPKDDPNQKKAVKILTPERSLILFNSKTIHANIGMVKNHPKGKHINRFSAYLTFVPRERQSEEIKKKRIDGYFKGVSCSHWADRYEPKKIPFHIRGKYQNKGFRDLVINTDTEIYNTRLQFI
ncbi:MAG: hypothetical protein CBB97_15620 [Candidatus Endolissoclinum sp. TMED37]|nr:MAG: hypothetical protein CBB97_15620 [Candidatus Endolissoclinum sp. TMED37]